MLFSTRTRAIDINSWREVNLLGKKSPVGSPPTDGAAGENGSLQFRWSVGDEPTLNRVVDVVDSEKWLSDRQACGFEDYLV
jgi:hypothetical protein